MNAATAARRAIPVRSELFIASLNHFEGCDACHFLEPFASLTGAGSAATVALLGKRGM
jgi:hypothetical protein